MDRRISKLAQSADDSVGQISFHELDVFAQFIPSVHCMDKPQDLGIISKQDEPHALSHEELFVAGAVHPDGLKDLLGCLISKLFDFLLLLL